VIADGHLAPANLHDLTLADDVLADAHGWVTGFTGAGSSRAAGRLGRVAAGTVTVGSIGRGCACPPAGPGPAGGSRR
jgi:hypothetical protein